MENFDKEKRYLDRLQQLSNCAQLVAEAEAELEADNIFPVPPEVMSYGHYADLFAAIRRRITFVHGNENAPKLIELRVSAGTGIIVAMYKVGDDTVKVARVPEVFDSLADYFKSADKQAQVQAQIAAANPGWRVAWVNS